MSDTQWRRFEVFLQERPGRPHQNAGSVHAPDAEMALMNARDVFVRRPACHSLWVVPAEAILSRTAEELAAQRPAAGARPPNGRPETYHVFQKRGQRRAMSFVQHSGSVEAAGPEDALRQALAQFEAADAFVWWVLPAAAVIESREEEAASLFEPAEDKDYRLPQAYRVLTVMLDLTGGRESGAGIREFEDE
ncbi:MAG: phenylacetic acid degradation protein [Candidatus Promineifilaceae bacterium]